MSEGRKEQNSPLLIVGGLLIVAGAVLMARQFGLIPQQLLKILSALSSARGPVALVFVGVVVIVLANRGGSFRVPAHGTRLYRSRGDKVISGVLGGLAKYFGIDSTLVRLGFIALAFVGGAWTATVAYIVLAVVMPEEPKTSPQAG